MGGAAAMAGAGVFKSHGGSSSSHHSYSGGGSSYSGHHYSSGHHVSYGGGCGGGMFNSYRATSSYPVMSHGHVHMCTNPTSRVHGWFHRHF